MLTLRGLQSDSTCVFKAEPGKLDIKRHESGIIFISLPISTAKIKALRGSLGALSVNKLSHIPKL